MLFRSQLLKLNEYFDKLARVLKRRYGRGESGNVDSGGQINTSRIIAPNPRWHLVDESFELFDSLPHLSSLGRDSRLLEFVLYIHEWVTGDDRASFERVMREYGKVRRELKNHKIRREALPDGDGKGARQLDRKIYALRDKLLYGHRIPARHIASLGR